MKKVGLVINPIAGMGGSVGLKGTDGKEILAKAREMGSKAQAPDKAKRALKKLLPIKDDVTFLVAEGDMGSNECEDLGLNYDLVYRPEPGDTSADDTKKLCQIIADEGVDLIIFAGGDGTARDVSAAVGTKIPSIGIPAGVKIHSSVYGSTPENSGDLARDYLQGAELSLKDAEVMDIKEDAFRKDQIDVEVFGFLSVPYDQRHLQNQKSPSPQSDHEAQEAIALYIVDKLEDDVYYIIGSGTTTARVMEELGLDHTILGVDVIKNKELIAKDVNEQEMLDIIKGKDNVKLIVTPMGGQGYVFGRGNQQLSAAVLREIDKENIIIMATPHKLHTIGDRNLIIYTMDDEVDEKLSGYYKIITGYGRYHMWKASNGNEEE